MPRALRPLEETEKEALKKLGGPNSAQVDMAFWKMTISERPFDLNL